jgi:UDP-N-acetylmuramoyl-L-alanyl-D-glutamate--2,6-diaminopimelate ligase
VRVLSFDGRLDGSTLMMAFPDSDAAIKAHLVGRTNAYNILAAASAALALGIAPEAIKRGIESLDGVPGRMELVRAGQPFTVIVDYAHTPDALEKLLETVGSLPHGRLITVFGCGGDRDRRKRPVMGDIAGRLSDYVIATSDNPRTEDPEAILAEIEPGLRKATSHFTLNPDRREAIGAALAMARADDVVVIAGKGHEDYQVIGTRTYPFDDRTIARELILPLLTPSRSADGSELH